jgi:hypothetical protein
VLSGSDYGSVSGVMDCGDGSTKSWGQPAVAAGWPPVQVRSSAYCLPMTVPLILMLSSSTTLEPVSGPSSRTM